MAIPLCATQEPEMIKVGEKHFASCHRIGEA
jgi:hypothetical protein